jgi:hypothetical protein|tara:strand:+ start:107 stop:322 length:216 start_codon:yes stop_codon:yes gene_type:complete
MVTVKKLWLKRKLKRSKLKKARRNNMENNQKDVTIEVTGVSMSGEASINEHDGPIESDKEEPTKEETTNSD